MSKKLTKKRVSKVEKHKDLLSKSNIRRQEIKDLIEELGMWNVNITALAKKFNVSRNTIYADIDKIIEQIDPKKLTKIKFDFDNAYHQAIGEMRNIIRTGEVNSKIQAANSLGHLIDKHTKFMESYELKPKVADKTEIDMTQPVEVVFHNIGGKYPDLEAVHEKEKEKNKKKSGKS